MLIVSWGVCLKIEVFLSVWELVVLQLIEWVCDYFEGLMKNVLMLQWVRWYFNYFDLLVFDQIEGFVNEIWRVLLFCVFFKY